MRRSEKKSISRRNFFGYWLVYTLVRLSRGTKGTGFAPRDGHPHFFSSFFSLLIITFPLFYFFSVLFFFFLLQWATINLHSKEHFNGDAADSTEFCVVNCIANRSAKSFSRRESEKINKPQK